MPSKLDPDVATIEAWLAAEPKLTALAIVVRLSEKHPEQFGTRQHSIVQRLLKALRKKTAEKLIAAQEPPGARTTAASSPWAVDGSSKAERRVVGRVAKSADMRGRLSGPPGITSQRRIDDGDRDVGVREVPLAEIPLREILDADSPALHDWPQRAFPDADPTGVQDRPEIRVELVETALLFFDGKQSNDHHSPKKVLRGVARAAAGAATAAPSAGTRPMRGM